MAPAGCLILDERIRVPGAYGTWSSDWSPRRDGTTRSLRSGLRVFRVRTGKTEGAESGIRTHTGLSPAVFKTAASAVPPFPPECKKPDLDPEARLTPWSGRRDSNPRPSPWQGDALPTEPLPLARRSSRRRIAHIVPRSRGSVKDSRRPCRRGRDGAGQRGCVRTRSGHVDGPLTTRL